MANNGSYVRAYDTTTGAATAGFTDIRIAMPFDVLASGSLLYASNQGATVRAYNAATGFTTITSLASASGLAISGSTLYVTDEGLGRIGHPTP